jgi:hypothetical protein
VEGKIIDVTRGAPNLKANLNAKPNASANRHDHLPAILFFLFFIIGKIINNKLKQLNEKQASAQQQEQEQEEL